MNITSTTNSTTPAVTRAKPDTLPVSRNESADGPDITTNSPVQFTPKSLLLHQVEVTPNEAPMRTDRIAELREQIKKGEYIPDVMSIARKMFEAAQQEQP